MNDYKFIVPPHQPPPMGRIVYDDTIDRGETWRQRYEDTAFGVGMLMIPVMLLLTLLGIGYVFFSDPAAYNRANAERMRYCLQDLKGTARLDRYAKYIGCD